MNIENNCTISIESRIESDGETEIVTSKEHGVILTRNGAWFISYTQEGIPMKIVLTSDGNASVSRGNNGNRLILIPGGQTLCSYNTDYFPIDLKIHTTKVQHDLSQSGGIIRLHYSIIHDEDQIQHFKLKLTVTEGLQ